MVYVGIDWSDPETPHRVYITDDSGDRISAFTVEHTPEGMQSLFSKVRKMAKEQAEVLFALETPRGLVASSIIEAGFTLYPINPKSVDRYRDRYTVSGKKDDYFDAMVLANILRTDRHNHRPLLPDSPLTRELRAYTGGYDALVKTQTMFSNQITSHLKDYYPVALNVFARIDQMVTLNFLEEFPTPDSFQRASKAEIEKVLKKSHYPGTREKTAEIFALSKKPQFKVEVEIAEAKSLYLRSLVKQLKNVLASLQEFEQKIAELLEKHPDKDIFTSLPGAANMTAARFISHFGDNRSRYQKAAHAQAEAGTCPITIRSGKSIYVSFRHACRKPFRNTATQFAFTSMKESEWARQKYTMYRQRNGGDHNQALRCLANAWLEIIFPMWRDRTLYNVEKHLWGFFKEQKPSMATDNRPAVVADLLGNYSWVLT